MSSLHAGLVLHDRYRVAGLLATGGMAEIWVADDLLLQRQVALKVLRPGIPADLDAAERLRAEARAASRLTSRHVVRVHDVDELVDADGRQSPYIVMELVPGRSLREVMHDEGALPAATVALLLQQVAGALREAHEAGMVHRDIKPANVLVEPDGTCKVADFGIASFEGEAALTATGLVMGTARYLSPEQVSGARATAASDVYSLGVVAHECLRGVPMHDSDGEISAALAHVRKPPPALPSDVPHELASLVLAMLAKDPVLRPTAAQVAALQVPARHPAPTRALPLVVPGPRTPSGRSRKLQKAGAGIGIAATALLLLGLVGGHDAARPKNPTVATVAELPSPTPTHPATVSVKTVAVVATARPKPATHVVPAATTHGKKHKKPKEHDD